MTEKEYKAVLKKIEEGLATKARILAPADGCAVCGRLEGAYDFGDVPELPPEDCGGAGGMCRLMYAPVLDQFGP